MVEYKLTDKGFFCCKRATKRRKIEVRKPKSTPSNPFHKFIFIELILLQISSNDILLQNYEFFNEIALCAMKSERM